MNKKVFVLLALMSFSPTFYAMSDSPWTSTGGDDIYYQGTPEEMAAKVAAKLALEAAKRAAQEAAKSEVGQQVIKTALSKISEVFFRIVVKF